MCPGSLWATSDRSALTVANLIRSEPERAPNTRGTGSGFICIYIYLWGDYFHEQRVKLRIANVGNGRQARVRTALKAQRYLQKRAR